MTEMAARSQFIGRMTWTRSYRTCFLTDAANRLATQATRGREDGQEQGRGTFFLIDSLEGLLPAHEVLWPGEPGCGHGVTGFPGRSPEPLLAEDVVPAAKAGRLQPGAAEQVGETEPGGDVVAPADLEVRVPAPHVPQTRIRREDPQAGEVGIDEVEAAAGRRSDRR